MKKLLFGAVMLIGTLTFASTGIGDEKGKEKEADKKESFTKKDSPSEYECVLFEYTCGLDGMACGSNSSEIARDAAEGEAYFCHGDCK